MTEDYRKTHCSNCDKKTMHDDFVCVECGKYKFEKYTDYASRHAPTRITDWPGNEPGGEK